MFANAPLDTLHVRSHVFHQMPNRRSIIQGAGVGLLASLGGCSALGSNPSPQATISGIYVTNNHDEPHTVYLLIFDKESDEPMEPVYFRSKTFEANDPDEKYQVGGGHFEGLPTDPGNYHVEVRLDQRKWDSESVDAYENLPERIIIDVTIGYMFKESGPPAWRVTVTEAKDERTTSADKP